MLKSKLFFAVLVAAVVMPALLRADAKYYR